MTDNIETAVTVAPIAPNKFWCVLAGKDKYASVVANNLESFDLAVKHAAKELREGYQDLYILSAEAEVSPMTPPVIVTKVQ